MSNEYRYFLKLSFVGVDRIFVLVYIEPRQRFWKI